MIKQYAFASLFGGRAQERVEIGARLAEPDCRLLTLTGLGGSGKTRLALEVAHARAPDFPHGASSRILIWRTTPSRLFGSAR